MIDEPYMLSPKEVAEILGVHQKTVHLWLRTGKLGGVKISYRTWRIPRNSLSAFIERSSNLSQKNRSINSQKQLPSDIVMLKKEPTKLDRSVSTAASQSKMKRYIRDIMGEHAHEEQ
jgi:excisionase family DNA binding protein